MRKLSIPMLQYDNVQKRVRPWQKAMLIDLVLLVCIYMVYTVIDIVLVPCSYDHAWVVPTEQS